MAKKVIKPLFEDAVFKPKGPEPTGDCVYVGGDAGIPLVLGETLGEDSGHLTWLKNQG